MSARHQQSILHSRKRVLVPTAFDPANVGSHTLSNSNRTITAAAASAAARTLVPQSSGRWYWEMTNVSVGAGTTLVGVSRSDANFAAGPGFVANSYGYYGGDGFKYVAGAAGAAYGATHVNGDVISVLLDLDAGTLTFWKNGASQGVLATGLAGAFYPAWDDGTGGSGAQVTFNFGNAAFSYTPPQGYNPGFGLLI